MSTSRDDLLKRVRHNLRISPQAIKPSDNAKNELEYLFSKEVVRSQKLTNDQIEGLNSIREIYAAKIFEFLVFWGVGIGVIIFLQGFKICGFYLETSLLNVLVGATTVNVLALAGLVVKGAFSK